MVTTFYPPHVGGIEYHVANLSKHLAIRGHRVTIITAKLDQDQCASQDSVNKDLNVVTLNTVFLPAWPYRSMSSMGISYGVGQAIREISEEEHIDIVHVHGHHYPLTWSAIAAAHKLKLPTFLTLHGLYALGPTKPFGSSVEELFNLSIFKNILNKATAVIGLTPTITSYAKKYGPREEKYFTIPNGVDINKFGAANSVLKNNYKIKYSLPLDKIIILFRGRFADVKGIIELAQAAKVLVKDRKDVFFVFVGGGLLSGQLKQISDCYSINSKIINWVSESEISELYLASDIFVLPSKSEALPITIIEAMASHLYIVVAPVGGVPDVLSNYPWKTYIEEISVDGINRALGTALDSFRVKTDGELTVVSSILERYDWKRIVREIEDVYRTKVEGKVETLE
jgi:D-inositol-3-phosphate glycosyltransferase